MCVIRLERERYICDTLWCVLYRYIGIMGKNNRENPMRTEHSVNPQYVLRVSVFHVLGDIVFRSDIQFKYLCWPAHRQRIHADNPLTLSELFSEINYSWFDQDYRGEGLMILLMHTFGSCACKLEQLMTLETNMNLEYRTVIFNFSSSYYLEN